MGNGDTGKIKALTEKATNPYVVLTTIATMLGTIVTGGTWAIGKMEASEAKSDSAMEAVKKIEGSMDTFIMLQREANALKREEMVAQGIRIQTRSVETSSSETSRAIESSVEAVSVKTSTGLVIVEYKPDSLRSGIIRKADTVWVPIQDTAATRPR